MLIVRFYRSHVGFACPQQVISAAGALAAGREREPAPKRPRDGSGLSFDVGSAVAMAGDAARQDAVRAKASRDDGD